MNFKPELAQAVMSGRKTVTRRLVSHNSRSPWFTGDCKLKVGKTYAVCPGRGKNAIGRVKVTSVVKMQLGRLNVDEARKEGFRDSNHFEGIWHSINGKYDETAPVWRVEFEVAEIGVCAACGHPGDDCICWYIAETERIGREPTRSGGGQR